MTATGLPLRDYQVEILSAVRRALLGEQRGTGSGPVNRPAVAAATGGGKTVMFSHLLTDPQWTPSVDRRSRRLVLVHRDELAQQARKTILAADPGLASDGGIGIVKAEQNEVDAHVCIASVQTLASPGRAEAIRDVGMVICDEAHHASAPTWRGALAQFGAWNGVPTIGWSATLARADDQHLGDIWQEVVAQWTIIDGVKSGNLVDVRGLRIQVSDLDTAKIRRSHGDLQAGQLSEALHDAEAPEQVAKAYAEHGMREDGTPRPAVVFAPSVETAQATAQALTAAGFPAELVCGDTPLDERAGIYERFRRGETVALANAMVLTEGWDAPWCEVAIIMRATRSTPLYTQMIGRILRPWPGKTDALVLDVVGASEDNELATLADLSKTVKVVKGEIDEGTSLLDAFTAAEEQLYGVEQGPFSGAMLAAARRGDTDTEVHATAFDLLSKSKALWMSTPKGTMFIPSGDWILFAWPAGGGTFTLGRIANRPVRSKAIKLDGYENLPLDYALQHLERLALENDRTLSSKKAAWRQSSTPATMAQIGYAGRIGVQVKPGMTKAELSDAISVRIAEIALD